MKNKKEESFTQANVEEFEVFRSLLLQNMTKKHADSTLADRINDPYYKKMIGYLFDLRNSKTKIPTLSWAIKKLLEDTQKYPDTTSLRSQLIWVRYVHAIATFHYLYAEVMNAQGIFGDEKTFIDAFLRQLLTRKDCLNLSDIEKALDNSEKDITELVKITEDYRARARWLEQARTEVARSEEQDLAGAICFLIVGMICPPPAIVFLGLGIAGVCLGAPHGLFIAAFVLSALFFAVLATTLCYANFPYVQIERAQNQHDKDCNKLCGIESKIRKSMNDSLSLIKFPSDFKVSESPHGFLHSETKVARKTSILDSVNTPVFN